MMSRKVLIAEDDLVLQQLYRAYLLEGHSANSKGQTVAVSVTDSPEEVKRWLREGDAPLLLDGSVFRQMGVPLTALPGQVVICTGDDELVEEALSVGLRAFCKGKGELSALSALMQEVRKAAERGEPARAVDRDGGRLLPSGA